MGAHHQLLFPVEGQGPDRREHLHTLDRGGVGLAHGHSLSDPPHQAPVVVGTDLQTLAPAMRQLGRSFGHQHRSGRIGRKETPPAGLADQMLVILVGLEPEQREAEPVLSGRLAMAPTTVAAVLGEDGHDLVGEVQRSRLPSVDDPHRNARGGSVAGLGGDHRLTIGHRDHPSRGIEANDARGLGRPSHLAGHIARPIQCGQQLLSGILGVEGHFAGPRSVVQFERAGPD